MSVPPRPQPEARLLAEGDPAPEGGEVWLYSGTLERFTGGENRFRYRQRICWPAPPTWAQVCELGQWMAERLSVNGHVLVGLTARREEAPAEEARLIAPGS